MTIDKSKVLNTTIKLLNEKLHFEGEAGGDECVSIDYTPPLGDNLGFTSLELFLLSLSSCIGSAILVLLRRMKKSIDNFEVSSTGYRNTEHPTGFKSINLIVNINSTNTSSEDMTKAIDLIQGICPVLSMLDVNVKVTIEFKLETFGQ